MSRRYDHFKTQLEHFLAGPMPFQDFEYLYYEMKKHGLKEHYVKFYDELFAIIETDAPFDRQVLYDLAFEIVNE